VKSGNPSILDRPSRGRLSFIERDAIFQATVLISRLPASDGRVRQSLGRVNALSFDVAALL
jgi:hypothetical protein